MKKLSLLVISFLMILTPVFSINTYSGSGDDVVIFQKVEIGKPAIVHVTGNASSQYMGVVGYDSNGNYMDLLVNTAEPYDGYVPLDFIGAAQTSIFEVTATGPWTIEVLSLEELPSQFFVSPGNSISGTGACVVGINGSPKIAAISGNAASEYFGVIAYSKSSYLKLLVNTADVYSGRALLSSGTKYLAVSAVGPWTISL